MASRTLTRHLETLSYAYSLAIDDELRWVVAHGFRLPPGYNLTETSVLITLPRDYPVSPPGVGDSRVYMSPHLRFRGRELENLHASSVPGWDGEWAWLCYQYIKWDPRQDNLITFLEMVRADLTDAPTRSSFRPAPARRPPPRRSLFQSIKEILT